MLDKHSNNSDALYILKKTFSLGSYTLFLNRKEVLTKQDTQTHTHVVQSHTHTDASQIT